MEQTIELNMRELIELRKLAVQVAQTHSLPTGIASVLHEAQAICDFILAGKLPTVEMAANDS